MGFGRAGQIRFFCDMPVPDTSAVLYGQHPISLICLNYYTIKASIWQAFLLLKIYLDLGEEEDPKDTKSSRPSFG